MKLRKKVNKYLSAILAGLMLITSVPVYGLDVSGGDILSESTEISTEEDNSEISSTEENKEFTVSGNDTTEVYSENENGEGAEVPLDNWELGVVFYDSTVDNGETPLSEINWTPEIDSETRVIKIQINYKNTNAVTTYNPGELKIKIPNLGQRVIDAKSTGFLGIGKWYASRSYGKSNTLTADPLDTLDKEFAWSYELSKGETNPVNNLSFNRDYILTNNNTIEAGSNFEGTIQILYTINSESVLQTENFSLQAILNDEITSNQITFNFSSPKTNYDGTDFSIQEKLKYSDGLPADAQNYIWVKYMMFLYPTKTHNKLFRTVHDFYVKPIISDDCILLNYNMENATVIDNQKVLTIDDCQKWSGVRLEYFIGYPIDKYDDQIINQEVELWGNYCDNRHSVEKIGDIELVNTFIKENINLGEFKFNYDSIGATTIKESRYFNHSSYNMIRKTKARPEAGVEFSAAYPGYKYNLRVGNDVFGIGGKDSSFSFLKDNEYRLTAIDISNPYNMNNKNYPKDSVEFDLFVRYANTSEWVKYGTYKNKGESSQSQGIHFEENEHIVGFYVEYKNLTQGIQLGEENNGKYRIYMEVSKKDEIPTEGYIYSFSYIERYKYNENGELILDSNVSEDSYDSELSKIIAKYDMEHYSHYMQRSYAAFEYGRDLIDVSAYNALHENPKEDPRNERITYQTKIWYHITPDFYIDILKGFTLYDLLPEGVNLNCSEKEIINSIQCNDNFISQIKVNGKNFTDNNEFNEYLQSHAKVEVEKNYHNTNRTMLRVLFDFTDAPLDIEEFFSEKYRRLNIYLYPKFYISYNALEEYGLVYSDIVYMEAIPCDNFDWKYYGLPSSGYGDLSTVKDDGSKDPDAVDINNNGDITEEMTACVLDIPIEHVVESHQDIKTLVQTDNHTYDDLSLPALASLGSEYSYKLRVRAQINPITNLIVYDNLETAYGKNKYWKGEFQGIDTSSAESKGYDVKVWYSEKENAGKLSEDNSWKEYQGTSLKPDYSKTEIVTSPNWPNNYNSNMKEDKDFWIKEFPGADGIKITFDSTCKFESASYDYLRFYDRNGKNITKELFNITTDKIGGTDLAGKSITVHDDYIKITMRTDGSGQYKGFAAEATPIYAPTSSPTDSSLVKSLAFEFLDRDGNAAIIPKGSSLNVLIKMKAPSDEKITTLAYNKCWTEWNAVNEFNQPVDFITGITSNAVSVALPNSILTDGLPTLNLRFTKEIEGNENDFAKLGLNPDDEHSFRITLVSQELNEDGTQNIINGLLSTKTGLSIKLPAGTYLVSEGEDTNFDFKEMVINNPDKSPVNGVSFEKTDKGYLLTIAEDIEENITYNIKVINKIESNKFHEGKEEKTNLFSKLGVYESFSVNKDLKGLL